MKSASCRQRPSRRLVDFWLSRFKSPESPGGEFEGNLGFLQKIPEFFDGLGFASKELEEQRREHAVFAFRGYGYLKLNVAVVKEFPRRLPHILPRDDESALVYYLPCGKR